MTLYTYWRNSILFTECSFALFGIFIVPPLCHVFTEWRILQYFHFTCFFQRRPGARPPKVVVTPRGSKCMRPSGKGYRPIPRLKRARVDVLCFRYLWGTVWSWLPKISRNLQDHNKNHSGKQSDVIQIILRHAWHFIENWRHPTVESSKLRKSVLSLLSTTKNFI